MEEYPLGTFDDDSGPTTDVGCPYEEVAVTGTTYVCILLDDGHLVHKLVYGGNPND